MISDATHARILRKVAARALGELHNARRIATAAPTDDNVRTAYRHAVLASRTLRRAAEVTPDESGAMLAEAAHVDAAAVGLLDELVRSSTWG